MSQGKKNAVVERLKRMVVFAIVVGFLGYFVMNFANPILEGVTNLWRPLFEITGIDEEFGVDPTGIVYKLVALIMTAVVLLGLAYLGTSKIGEKCIQRVVRQIPFVKNFAPQVSDDKLSEQAKNKMRITRDELRTMQPVLIPHFMGPRSEKWATAYELVFIQGVQLLRIHENGHDVKEEVGFRGFKPSWPFMFQGTPVLVFQTRDLLRVRKEDFEQLEKWFTAGGFTNIDPLDVEPWKENETLS